MNDPLFELGQVVATAGAALAFARAKTQPEELLDRHRSADFGEVEDTRKKANLEAMQSGGRVASAYLLRTGDVVLVLTENRSTTILSLSEFHEHERSQAGS